MQPPPTASSASASSSFRAPTATPTPTTPCAPSPAPASTTSGTRTPTSGSATASSSPAASPTATTCAAAPSPASAPMMQRSSEFAERRRPGHRHLQRLPDPARGRPAARRAAAQRLPAVPLPLRQPAGRERRHAVHQRLPARASCCASPSRTARATTRPTGDAGPDDGERPGRPALLRPPTASTAARQPQRLGRQHRRHLQRAAQRLRPDAPPRALAARRSLAGGSRRALHLREHGHAPVMQREVAV